MLRVRSFNFVRRLELIISNKRQVPKKLLWPKLPHDRHTPYRLDGHTYCRRNSSWKCRKRRAKAEPRVLAARKPESQPRRLLDEATHQDAGTT